jgi:hypothetical protein
MTYFVLLKNKRGRNKNYKLKPRKKKILSIYNAYRLPQPI